MAGRPTKFRPEFVQQAKLIAKLGATDADLSAIFGVNRSTIFEWQEKHPEFAKALKVGKHEADAAVEKSLYRKATGYSFDATKIFQFEGRVVTHDYVEHCPPDTTACIFWLKNRQPEAWRDRIENNVNGNVTLVMTPQDARL